MNATGAGRSTLGGVGGVGPTAMLSGQVAGPGWLVGWRGAPVHCALHAHGHTARQVVDDQNAEGSGQQKPRSGQHLHTWAPDVV